jgi:hypothetical protein
MFRQLAARTTPNQLFALHPVILAGLLEKIWDRRFADPTVDLGHPNNRSNLNGLGAALPPDAFRDNFDDPLPWIGTTDTTLPSLRWDHLIYAYMIENTRVYEIFRRVVFELVHGEKLGTPAADTQAWLRSTEELFFKPGAPFFITSVVSDLRDDWRAIGRNAYKRMFDMELNHGTSDGKPYPYVKADAINGEFIATFEELLREVWIGMIYVTATSSSNPTDRSKIAVLATKLHDMLRSRRQNGNLSREEFSLVTAMSWFHLTIESNTGIVVSLRADATGGAEQRLFKIAERVGMPAHGLSKHFFTISDPLSRIMIQIETGDYNNPEAVPALFTPVTNSVDSPEAAMRQIITDWAAITGRDVKARKVAAS